MTLAPLANASLVIQIHTVLALFAVLLTIAIFTLPKGSGHHRLMGRTWVALMAGVALSSFWISELRIIGPFSPIHLLSVFVLWRLVSGVRAARTGNIAAHQRTMKSMTFGALVVAGAFTFFPGRVMYQMLLGG